MDKSQIQAMTTEQLKAIVASTNPSGNLWMQTMWARDELTRRKIPATKTPFWKDL